MAGLFGLFVYNMLKNRNGMSTGKKTGKHLADKDKK
jgi:hypothetical protein